MRKTFATAACALLLAALWPTRILEAANPHVFRFQADWAENADGSDCSRRARGLNIVSFAADVDVISLTFFNAPAPCQEPDGGGAVFLQANGQVDISGNLAHLFVQGTIFTGDGRPVEIDLTLRKTGNLPDPAPGEKAVSAVARGTVILDGADLTEGKPSNTASITRSKS